MAENSESQKVEAAPEVAQPVKKMTVEDFTDRLLKKILSDCGISLDQFMDGVESEKRTGYALRAVSKNVVPMPTAEEEAALMITRAGLNREGFSTKQILDALKAGELAAEKRERDQIKYAKAVFSAPLYMILIAKTLLFFKNLFKRSK